MGLFYRNQPFIFGETTYNSGGSYGPLFSSSLNLSMVISGRMEVRYDGKVFEVGAGRAVLIYSHKTIEFRYPAGSRTVVQWCETGEPAGSALVLQKLKRAPTSLEASKTLRQLMRIGTDHSLENQEEVRAFRDALGETAICAYLRQANLDSDEAIVPDPVIRGKEYIEAHFSETIGSASIAHKAGVSAQHLVRQFKQYYGLSPTEHLWNLRAEKGAFLLRQSGLTVGEVAYQCGYKNPFHFSRHVKARFGHSPVHLRRLKSSLHPALHNGLYPDLHNDPHDLTAEGNAR